MSERPRDEQEPQPPRIVEQPRATPPVDPRAWAGEDPRAAEPHAVEAPDDADELEIDPDYEPPRLVVIREYSNGLEAEIARLDLEASGIPAVIFAGGGNMLPYLQFSGGVRLAVPEWAVEDADLLLQPVEDDESPDDGQ